MSIVSFFAVYIVIWSLVLQAVLPFGIHTQAELGEIVEGSEPGAPAHLRHLKLKLLITSVISLALWGVFYWLYQANGLGMR